MASSYDENLLASAPKATKAQLQHGYNPDLLAEKATATPITPVVDPEAASHQPSPDALPFTKEKKAPFYATKKGIIIIAVLVIIVIIAAVVGGAVGGTRKKNTTTAVHTSKRPTSSTTSSAVHTSKRPTPSTTPSATPSTTPSATSSTTVPLGPQNGGSPVAASQGGAAPSTPPSPGNGQSNAFQTAALAGQ